MKTEEKGDLARVIAIKSRKTGIRYEVNEENTEMSIMFGLDEVVLEIPAGKLDSKQEDHEEAARRELKEETGYTAKELIPLGKFYPACAYSDETIWMYLAKGLELGERNPDEDEFLDVELIPLKDLVTEVLAGRIPDAKTQIAILKAAAYEGILK